MKPLLIFGFALTLSFLAPLAQATPAPTTPREPAAMVAQLQPAADDRRADPAPPAAEQREPNRAPHSDPAPDSGARARSNPVRGHDGTLYAPDITTAPDVDADQNSAPTCDNEATTAPDNSAGQSAANPAHYTMDDLANAAASLDAPYDSAHFSMDDIGGL